MRELRNDQECHIHIPSSPRLAFRSKDRQRGKQPVSHLSDLNHQPCPGLHVAFDRFRTGFVKVPRSVDHLRCHGFGKDQQHIEEHSGIDRQAAVEHSCSYIRVGHSQNQPCDLVQFSHDTVEFKRRNTPEALMQVRYKWLPGNMQRLLTYQ